jgi:putative DNA methylase
VATKKEFISQEVARAVGAGKAAAMETVDFSDPNRPKTCLEVDFPILPVNQVAVIEGNAGKPIYQMSKWWARRRSSVFRSMLIAAATKAPEDPSHAAKLVWDNYYANHQKKGAFKHLKVADIFMGGGTTLVEGSRLGMQMSGNDLNPVAWFVVKQELADVDLDDVKRLLADIEAEVKPQIMPFYYCDGPSGEKGIWTHKPSRRVMGEDFDPLSLKAEERKEYSYEGAEIICTFWAKHGPCQVTGCGHLTPIITSPVFATKAIVVKSWPHVCLSCAGNFDIEEVAARMAPGVGLYVSPEETPFAILDSRGRVKCPHCESISLVKLGKSTSKSINLALSLTPQWLSGAAKQDKTGVPLGGAVSDSVASTNQWNISRAEHDELVEIRGTQTVSSTHPVTGEVKTEKIVPIWVVHPTSGVRFRTDDAGGTVPKKSQFSCAQCGTLQDVLTAVSATGTTAPVAAYAIQGWSPNLAGAYGGRFFSLPSQAQLNAANNEWEVRKEGDLLSYFSSLPIEEGLETTIRTPLLRYGYKNWSDAFNPRQLLSNALLLKAIDKAGTHSSSVREFVLAAFQQYIRNNNMFCIWNIQRDTLEPFLSKNNLQPPTRPIENNVFGTFGRGNWAACTEGLIDALNWRSDPWEIVARSAIDRDLAGQLGQAKSVRVSTGDPPLDNAYLTCGSSTELTSYATGSYDLVITDPPFGDIMQYAELSSVFYGWLKPVLKHSNSNMIPENIPTALEAVENKARHGTDSAPFYSRVLQACWEEAHRVLKPGGILAFTFHHDKDEPWVAVLESLFNAGFYLEATYPIRSDETKGAGGTPGTFGAQKVEYDIIHVCRKRAEAPVAVSWGRMRREVLGDVRQLTDLLENHAKGGLPIADLQVIKRGKALEYFSRHYGKVYLDEGRPISVKDALVGINQLIDEDASKTAELPPVTAEPITRQFLRIFDGKTELARDQMQKLLRGSGIAPDEFTSRGWANEEKKVFHLADPLGFARDWQGKHRRRLTADLDQTLVLVGACYDGSGINASDTLKNDNFKPHPALKGLLEWLGKRAPSQPMRNASSRALSIYNAWAASNKDAVVQMSLFLED